MPIKVYSGIAPPPTLLARMAEGAEPGFPKPQNSGSIGKTQSPTTIPLSVPPAAQGQFGAPSGGNLDELPPPSYEDAIAEDIGPVDGPRRDYHQPGASGPAGGEKRDGFRRNDERLFS